MNKFNDQKIQKYVGKDMCKLKMNLNDINSMAIGFMKYIFKLYGLLHLFQMLHLYFKFSYNWADKLNLRCNGENSWQNDFYWLNSATFCNEILHYQNILLGLE